MNKSSFNRRILISTIALLLFSCFAFPSPAHAKKLNRLVREFVHDVTGVSLVKGVVGVVIGDMFSDAILSLPRMIFSPIPVFGQVIASSTTDKDIILARLEYKKHMNEVAKTMKRTYTNDEYTLIGTCKRTDFQKSFSPDCMTDLFSTESTSSSVLQIIQIKAATTGNSLYTYFKFNDKYEDTHGATPPLTGIGMLIAEGESSYLSLYCNNCKEHSDKVLVNNIFPPGTRVTFKGDEALFISPFGAVGLQPGDTFSFAGIIRTETLRSSPFVRAKIPESTNAGQ